MSKHPRPWKKHATIMRCERNNGDVYFFTRAVVQNGPPGIPEAEFQTLDEAEAALDLWWNDYWPKQIKSSKPA